MVKESVCVSNPVHLLVVENVDVKDVSVPEFALLLLIVVMTVVKCSACA